MYGSLLSPSGVLDSQKHPYYTCAEEIFMRYNVLIICLLLDRDACYTTQPVELLNPESMLTFGSDYVSGPRKSLLNLRDQTATGPSAAHGVHSEVHDNGAVEGTPGRNSNGDTLKTNHRLSFDSVADDRLERLSIAESEGSASGHSNIILR